LLRHDIEQWIDEATETGFDDTVIADRPQGKSAS
jgi:hypothetical protein